MKNATIKFLGLFAIVTAVFFSSCADPCKDVVCENGGECVEGTCNCADGYEGTLCADRQTAKFAGVYNVVETIGGVTFNYTCTVTESSTEVSRINFSNFYDLLGTFLVSTPVYGTVTGTDVVIPTQTINDGADTYIISAGTGSISGTTITFTTYSVNVNGGTDICSAVYTRQ